MKTRDRYLTGILLILIGILIGTLLTMYQQGYWVNDHAQVKFTEVKKSDEPVYTDEQLQSLDSRFLFKSVAEKITPTVVYIEAEVRLNDAMPDDENHKGRGDFFDRFVQRRARTVGSGVIISKDGFILTNNHVIEGAVDGGIHVVLNDKRMYRARITGIDPTTDLAVLKIDETDLPAIVIGNSDKVHVGEWVMAIGNPFRLRSTVTAGIVSALSRDVQIINDRMRIESFIQTDAAINRGNSGGALVNTSGELIGINTAIASQSGNYQGYGFAIPSNLAGKVARDLIEFGKVHRALLGVSIISVDAIRARELGLKHIQGVEIASLSPGGAAEKYGLNPGDVIFSINGEAVDESNQLQEKIAVLRPGETIQLKVWRDGQILDKEVKLGKLEEDSPLLSANTNSPSDRENGYNDDQTDTGGIHSEKFELGFQVMALRGRDDVDTQLVITAIKPGSEAGRKGLKEGYVIQKVNHQKVEDIKTLKDLIARSLERSQSVMLQIETSDGAKGYYQLNSN